GTDTCSKPGSKSFRATCDTARKRSAMHSPPATLHINKVVAASRQLDAAIRMFFAREDELAIHTVASAAFQILRNLMGRRGRKFTSELLQAGIYSIAREYAEGRLTKQTLKLIEDTQLKGQIEKIIDDLRAEGDKFDVSRIHIIASTREDQRAWPSKAANFLKHADRDAEEHLAVDEVKNENVLIGACTAYLELMRVPTPEIMAFAAFYAVKMG